MGHSQTDTLNDCLLKILFNAADKGGYQFSFCDLVKSRNEMICGYHIYFFQELDLDT